ncbi:uncharacterized protein LOC111712569 [Eurytemora carolleeae]|uniref:uncharacterized protein LOC111712569 n=1 Tax=Eurytemora carolleeae TaxID=1294199 RepID=UPI000C75E822|nr:uncharacterized protein LOC111712569 [Eurytemora carolleeae]|eukprot:XP_023342989.1 uncharacterized protein LOC111712569 [Eurytemora affinis]
MRRPVTTYRDESVGAKWNELQDYEKDVDSNGGLNRPSLTIQTRSPKIQMTTKEKISEFRKLSSRRLYDIKNQLSGKYRLKLSDTTKYLPNKVTRSDISTSPTGSDKDQRAGGARSISGVGRGIKSSKSLQNLEQITKDGWRQVADKTSYLGQNLKHKYSSKVDINKLAPKMNYTELEGDVSDDEFGSSRPNELF